VPSRQIPDTLEVDTAATDVAAVHVAEVDTPVVPVVGPLRTCVGCRSVAPRSILLRTVVRTDGTGSPVLVVDADRRQPGRGAWLHPDLTCLELAERRRAFPRALRRAGALDVEPVRSHLERR
jgi:hypothetical protein